ncbi:MAG: hypothetical protein ACRD5B_14375 [Nitrososphaeraceae archaeon]
MESIQNEENSLYNKIFLPYTLGLNNIFSKEEIDGGISSLNIGPDGLLYVVSVEHGKVYRIIPTK